MDWIKEKLSSKKLRMTITGIAVVIGGQYFGIDEATVTKIVGLVMSYVVGQGIADAGKEKARIERNISK